MSTQELPEELIILGNGFDLRCGLKSSYKSFFESYLDVDLKKSIEALFTSFCDKKEFELSNEELTHLNETSNSVDFDSLLALKEKHKTWEKKKSEFDKELSNLLKNDAYVSINFFDIYFILNSSNEISYPNWSDRIGYSKITY